MNASKCGKGSKQCVSAKFKKLHGIKKSETFHLQKFTFSEFSFSCKKHGFQKLVNVCDVQLGCIVDRRWVILMMMMQWDDAMQSIFVNFNNLSTKAAQKALKIF